MQTNRVSALAIKKMQRDNHNPVFPKLAIKKKEAAIYIATETIMAFRSSLVCDAPIKIPSNRKQKEAAKGIIIAQ